MKFSARTQAPPTELVLKLVGRISKKSTSTGTQSEKDFFKRVELKLKEIQRHDTSTGSSPFSETRNHWQSKSHFDMRALQTALVDISVSNTHDCISCALANLSVA